MRFFTFVVLAGLPLLLLPAQAAFGQAQWTFMVYLDGDNDLESPALTDFLEMASAGSDSNVNILVQLDRIPGESSAFGNWTICHRFHVTPGMTPSEGVAVANWGDGSGGREVNMGDPQVLTSFVQWGITNYPANRYALILWNHGNGWREGGARGDQKKALRPWKAVCWDDTSNDELQVREVATALQAVSTPVDVIGFDACLMAMVEVAYEIRGEGAVMVGSEEVEPTTGWPFDGILTNLKAAPTQTADQLGTLIVTQYGLSTPSGTQSAVDLTLFNALASAIDTFCNTVLTEDTDWDVICEGRSTAGKFTYSNHVDFLSFVQVVAAKADNALIRSAAQALETAMSAVVIANYAPGSVAGTGLTVYFGDRGFPVDSDYSATNLAFVADTAWDAFLADFVGITFQAFYEERFSSGLPQGWTVVDGGTDGQTWVTNNPGSRSSQFWNGGFMIVDSDWAGLVNMDEELITASIDCSAHAEFYLRFTHEFIHYSNEVGTVAVSVASGPWQTLMTFTGADSPGEVVIDCASIAGSQSDVRFRWRYSNAFFDWYWGIDNMRLVYGEGSYQPPAH
ncbi:MAG: clostripain-related cysteine peptidase [Planctomycetota bacterium]|jgi:hypothetical protein